MQEITISGIEEKDGKVTLEEQIGDQQYPTRYSFFKTYQDGNSTPVYDRFQDLDLKIGDIVTIEVKETKKVNSYGKEVTYRNIVSFPPKGETTATPTTAEPNAEPTKPTGRPMEFKSQPKKEFKTSMDYKADQIAKAQDSKEESMRLFSSGRDATLMLTSCVFVGTDEERKAKLLEWRNWFYQHVYHMEESEYQNLNAPF